MKSFPAALAVPKRSQFHRYRVISTAAVLISAVSPSSTGQEEAAQGRPTPPPSRGGSLISRIAFGSCSDQDRPQPVLETVTRRKPDLFVYLGDNIYGDTRDMAVLEEKYAELAARPEFQTLVASVPVVATWDDHDYGENDAGREYPKKVESKEVFLRFWNEPADSRRRDHPGIYTSYRFGGEEGGHTLQLILLDTRTFRDPLARNGSLTSWKNDYHPDPDPAKTFLGEEQWNWLRERFQEPADVRIVATSIQFGHEYNGWESWTNFPSELRRMVELIDLTQANGVLFISGDVHWGEISVLDIPGAYPIHDVTSSGINNDWPTIEPNRNRFGEPVRDYNFGMIEIDWEAEDPQLTLSLLDVSGSVRVQKEIRLGELRFAED